MLSFLASPGFEPFSIAGLVLIGLLVIETISTLVGTSVSSIMDTVFGLHGFHFEAGPHHGAGHDLSAHGTGTAAGPGVVHAPDGPFATAFNWLNAGRVPLLVLMMAAIACFAVTGMVVQILASHFLAPLPATAAALVAVLAAIPGTRWTSRLVSRIIPRDETYVLTDDGLIGRVGTVTLGPVAAGTAARAKVQDKYGNWHFPRVIPGAPDLTIPEGASILIVEKVGNAFGVIEAEGRLAPGKESSNPA